MNFKTDKITTEFDNKGKCFYMRSNCKKGIALQNQLALRYGDNKTCIITNSGLHAISSLFISIMMKYNWDDNINLIHGSELYGDTGRILHNIPQMYSQMCMQSVDVTNDSQVLHAFQDWKGKVNILYIESCSNPTGQIFNFDLIPQLKELSKDFCLIVDNTWLTDVVFNPFDYGANFVVLSLSKHYSGGNCISGAIIGNENSSIIKNTRNRFKIEGIHVNPLYCQIITNNLAFLDGRIKRTSDITKIILKYLHDNRNNSKYKYTIKHCWLSYHVSHDRYKKYFKNDYVPSIISLQFNLPKNQLIELIKSSKFPYETSFGGSHSKFDCWPFRQDGKTYCRFAIGYNDKPEIIIKNLDEMLKQ